MAKPTWTDRDFPVPDGAQFYRPSDESAQLSPIAADAAEAGDVVVLSDGRAGEYRGGGRVRLEGGEYAEFARLLPAQVAQLRDAPGFSCDPLEAVYWRPE